MEAISQPMVCNVGVSEFTWTATWGGERRTDDKPGSPKQEEVC